jgi:molybdate transport system substrate-binding protein
VLKGLYIWVLIGVLGLCACVPQNGKIARIAVATNFLETAQKLEAAFEADTDYEIDLVSGSTGQLYTQIINGAPYDSFLSADAARVTRLLDSGHGVEGTEFTYAIGQLVVYGTNNPETDLKAGNFKTLAIANPELAPYGLAAKQALSHMDLFKPAETKLIYGQNVGQAYGFLATGNAELGLVALSQMKKTSDIFWRVPENYYAQILQDGILLSRSKDNKSARAFLNYLRSSAAHNIIINSGYQVEPS